MIKDTPKWDILQCWCVVHKKVITPYVQNVAYIKNKFGDIVQREVREGNECIPEIFILYCFCKAKMSLSDSLIWVVAKPKSFVSHHLPILVLVLNLAPLVSPFYIDSIGRWFIRPAFHLPYKAKRACPGCYKGEKWILLWCHKDTRLIKISPCTELDVGIEDFNFEILLCGSQNNWWPSLIFSPQMQINLLWGYLFVWF